MRRLPIKEVRRIKRIVLISAITTSLIILLALIDVRLTKSVNNVSQAKMEYVVTSVINSSVGQVLQEEEIKYLDLVHIGYDQNNKINFAQFDTATITILKTKFVESINNALKSGELCTVKIPLGNLTNSMLLSGRGPDVNIRVQLYNSADVKVYSEFSDAGINQTLHRIVLEITAEYYVFMPGNKKLDSLTTNFCIAETLIVGDVPSAYTLIEEMPGETAGVINDYGASEI